MYLPSQHLGRCICAVSPSRTASRAGRAQPRSSSLAASPPHCRRRATSASRGPHHRHCKIAWSPQDPGYIDRGRADELLIYVRYDSVDSLNHATTFLTWQAAAEVRRDAWFGSSGLFYEISPPRRGSIRQLRCVARVAGHVSAMSGSPVMRPLRPAAGADARWL